MYDVYVRIFLFLDEGVLGLPKCELAPHYDMRNALSLLIVRARKHVLFSTYEYIHTDSAVCMCAVLRCSGILGKKKRRKKKEGRSRTNSLLLMFAGFVLSSFVARV